MIGTLRRQASAYDQSGVHPELKDGLEEALRYQPGMERAARMTEMRKLSHLDFEALFREGKASVATLNELIRAQAMRGRMDLAMKTHDDMQLHGYEPDEGTFVSLLVGAAKKRDAPLARKLFLKMREMLISASPKIYATLIKAHVRSGDLTAGFALIEKMEDERLKPDVVVYTVLIDGLVGAGKLERAWEEFRSARTWKLIQPDEILFTVMIKACAQAKEPERALNMLDDLRTCGLYPTDFTYGELIHAMATDAHHARKAFDFFRRMQAEDMLLTPYIFEKLLQACRSLGDIPQARQVIQEMRVLNMDMTPPMYCHLVGVFGSALQLPKVTESERFQNLRGAWQVVAEAKRCCHGHLDWTLMLNEVMSVYIAAGFPQYAVDLLQQYLLFDASPNTATYTQLLNLLGRDMKDVGRFFALWEVLPKDPRLPDELYHLALEMAMETRSAKRTCAMLEEMYDARVFPTPQLADRLAKVGRHVIQIHELVGKFVALNRDEKLDSIQRDAALLQTRMDEREVELAAIGQTVDMPTPEQEARKKHFDYLRRRGWFKRPWLPFGDYVASKQKGGEAYAKRHDRPRPNLIGA